MPQIKLKSADGKVFEVDVEVAKVSQTLKTMIEDLGMNEQEDEGEIPLTKINSNILEKVLEWSEHHKNDPEVVESPEDESNTEVDEWDREFLDVDQATLFDLITASNFLHIQGLCNAACKTVANIIRDKSPEEIRQIMGIENDFTPEEERQIRMEQAWSETKK